MSDGSVGDVSIRGRTIVVTGASSGIGRATAELLARSGAAVALVGRNEERLKEAASTCTASSDAPARWYSADFAQLDQVEALIPAVLRDFERIDGIVNGAAVMGPPTSELLSLDAAAWDAVFAVNVRAPFILSQHVARHIIGHGGGGTIVTVTSSAAHRTAAPVPYATSKAALGGMTRTLAGALGQYGINVNAVAPGLTWTPSAKRNFPDEQALRRAVSEGPLANVFGRVSEPIDVAQVIVLLCSPATRQVTGQTIHVSGGNVV